MTAPCVVSCVIFSWNARMSVRARGQRAKEHLHPRKFIPVGRTKEVTEIHEIMWNCEIQGILWSSTGFEA